MPESNLSDNKFLNQLKGIIEDNISDEKFGVSELAKAFGMSRSNLLRKIKKSTGLSVSQFIRQIRLENAMEMLKDSSQNISEVAYAVGFGSTSYFTKCFHDYYGFPPGETNKITQDSKGQRKNGNLRKILMFAVSTAVTAFAVFLIIYFLNKDSSKQPDLEKSIAVLPFKNESADISNVYIVNGLMESVLNNLQKIEDLRVISRTSVEKFRNNSKTIPEIANELNVSYIVEGSGQKINDKLLLTIQLIDASSDQHLWSEQFERNTSDIFDLQREVAKKIVKKIQVIVTPEEQKRIDKIPTKNLIAYDYFLKGFDQINQGTVEGLESSIVSFKKAIEHDSAYARAYAGVAMAYYYLDIFKSVKKYKDEINYYADKALFYDATLEQSLIAKSLYYQSIGDCNLAIPYLKKALEYNPNSALALNYLSDIYATCLPNTGKYLENALKVLKLDIAANDSTKTSINYLHVSNAFIQSGFVDEAEFYINKSLNYNPNNIFSDYVKAYIQYAKDKDLAKIKERLIATLKKDTTRLDVLQEIGKICYYMRDYPTSFKYFKKFSDARKKYGLGIFQHMDAEIGYVYKEMGFIEEAKKLFDNYKNYVDTSNSIYKNIELAMYHSYMGDIEKAFKYFEQFAKEEEDFHYWTILFLKIDPLMDNLKDHPKFENIYKLLEAKFWDNHKKIKKSLKQKELI